MTQNDVTLPASYRSPSTGIEGVDIVVSSDEHKLRGTVNVGRGAWSGSVERLRSASRSVKLSMGGG